LENAAQIAIAMSWQVGDLLWARVQGYPWWPGQVLLIQHSQMMSNGISDLQECLQKDGPAFKLENLRKLASVAGDGHKGRQREGEGY
jgi:hypothetical protein